MPVDGIELGFLHWNRYDTKNVAINGCRHRHCGVPGMKDAIIAVGNAN